MGAIYTLAHVVLACISTCASVMYARALVFMCASRMSRARNLSASHTHSLVKLHVSCTVGVKGSNDLASLVHSLCKCIKVEVSHVRR